MPKKPSATSAKPPGSGTGATEKPIGIALALQLTGTMLTLGSGMQVNELEVEAKKFAAPIANGSTESVVPLMFWKLTTSRLKSPVALDVMPSGAMNPTVRTPGLLFIVTLIAGLGPCWTL